MWYQILRITQTAESGLPSTLFQLPALENDSVGVCWAVAAAVSWQLSLESPATFGLPAWWLSGTVAPRGSLSAALLLCDQLFSRVYCLLIGLPSCSREKAPPYTLFSSNFPEESDPLTNYCIISLMKTLMSLRGKEFLLNHQMSTAQKYSCVLCASSLIFHQHWEYDGIGALFHSLQLPLCGRH